MNPLETTINITPIGTVSSPYDEKFAIPRQPGLVSAAKGIIRLTGQANHPDMVRGLSEFSHIWLLFIFHGTAEQGWKPLVRPPRLGGNKKLGVLATRSTFRPNSIGMSAVLLDKIVTNTTQTELHVCGIDLLNNTPIVDIKPYIPYSDNITDAHAGFANSAPDKQTQVIFTPKAVHCLQQLHQQLPELTLLIEQVLAQDPRPAYKQGKTDTKVYGMSLYGKNITWHVPKLNTIEVLEITG
ncbi:tRNA (N6-threonylcarbamoyladenosine(37)-N6)-methyltransferase TrmO [Thalassotalea sp. G2M2-11]|uniref:tRNA (N6-threonylcarbamoyladenosine(37)-N6)-methyltransferase TrmO n=1 Tax=Thalassotalea sp. G2M2-11 TaxID=2787627 RepID=UPI0019D27F36|nr:tRNA (N6-threonylcarbamoyladenosine(37)-N6)-methyltransferase TrmO [Thalassotalea sp. G2M2-11]